MQKAALSMFLSVASGVLLLAAPSAVTPALAEADLSGSWRGSGTVRFNSGATEQARCRATFSPSGQRAYDVSATCASQSGTVSQTAFIRGRGSNYRGTFYNPEFDTSGKIQISVSGGSQVVKLSSSKGSAVIRLSRAR